MYCLLKFALYIACSVTFCWLPFFFLIFYIVDQCVHMFEKSLSKLPQLHFDPFCVRISLLISPIAEALPFLVLSCQLDILFATILADIASLVYQMAWKDNAGNIHFTVPYLVEVCWSWPDPFTLAWAVLHPNISSAHMSFLHALAYCVCKLQIKHSRWSTKIVAVYNPIFWIPIVELHAHFFHICCSK